MSSKNQISLTSLVLMILSTAFGFVNVATAYDQMGYASIIWYIVGAVFFFIPTSFMFAEYGSALSTENGGVYSWIKSGLGERWAFVGTFIWLSAWVITIIFSLPNSWVSFSALLFGKDTTQSWSLLGMNGTQTIGILSIAFLIVATILSVRGMKSITILATIGGFLATSLVFIFCGLSIILIFLGHGHLAQPITSFSDFISSPNPAFKSPVSIMSFVVYAIFAYAGVESLSGVINNLRNPAKTFPRGVMIATGIMVVLYTVAIFLCGYSINWQSVMGAKSVTLGNVMYVLMANVGYAFGHYLNLSHGSTIALGHFLVRFTGFATFCGAIGSFFVLLYSPLKSFMMGSSKKLWPKWAIHLNQNEMPSHAMWIQTIVISLILFFISFGGTTAQQFYQILTDMNNVSTAFQYILIVLAFPFFKQIKNIERPFEAYRNMKVTWAVTILVLAVLVLGIGFNFVQPLLTHDYIDDFWTFLGPILFGGGALLFYEIDVRKNHELLDE